MKNEEKLIPVLIIADWDKSFENAKSRKVDHKSYGQFLLKQGRGYCRMMMEKDGAAIYGTFIALVGIVQSKSAPRTGYLTESGDDTGYPLSFADMAAMTRIPQTIIEKALVVLSSRAVGWIHADTMRIPRGYHEDTSISSEYARYPVLYCMESTVGYCRAGAEKKSSPEKKSEPKTNLPYSSKEFLEAWNGYMDSRKLNNIKTTDRAKTLLENKIKDLATTEIQAIKLLNDATMGGWRSVYVKKEFGNGKSNQDIDREQSKRKARDARRDARELEALRKAGIDMSVRKV